MKRFLKLILKIVIVILILYIVAIGLLFAFVKPDTYKHLITTVVKDRTGRQVQILGDINLSFFPWLGVRAYDIKVDNPKGFKTSGSKYFATVSELDFNVALWPLFKGDVEPKKIVLNNSTINLITLKNGKTNWKGLLNSSTQKTKSSGKSKGIIYKHNIPKVSITNANINWQNMQTNQDIKINDLNLHVNDISSSGKAQVQVNFKFHQRVPTLKFNLTTFADGSVNFNQRKLMLSSLIISGNLTHYKNHVKQPIPFQWKSQVQYNEQQQSLALSQINSQIGNATITGALNAKNLTGKAAFSGKIAIAKFSPKILLQKLNINYQIKPNAFNSASGSVDFKGTANTLLLSNIDLNLDQSQLTGSLRYAKVKEHNVNFKFALNKLNLDNYLAAKSSQSKKSKTIKNALPVKTLRLWNWRGTIHVNQLTYHKLPIKQLNIATANNNNVIKLSKFSLDIGKGQVTGNANINLSSFRPIISMNLNAQRVPLAATIQALTDKPRKIQGDLALTTSLQTQGNNYSTWMGNMYGKGFVNITNGDIIGIDLNGLVNKGVAFLQKKNAPQASAQQKTDFSTLQTHYSIIAGVVNGYDGKLTSPTMQATGKGQLNLNNNKINYQISAQIQNNGKSLTIPIQVSGTLDKPIIAPDFRALGESMLKQSVQKGIGNTLGNIFGKDIKKILP